MKKFIFLAILFINGCVTAPQFVVETPDNDQTRDAKSEILRKGNIYTNNLSRRQKLDRLERVKDKLNTPAKRLCLALGERESSNCNWEVYYLDEPEINAFATEGEDGNEVVIYMGVLDHTHSDEELAFIVAHEMSHHILNHISDDTGFTVGEGIGILLGLALIGDDDYDADSATVEDMTDLIGLTKNIGGAFDRPQYSRSQENESDFLAIQILYDANYDLNKAKQGLINIAASAEDTSSYPAFLASHPSGPQRLASFNSNMQSSKRTILINKIRSWCDGTNQLYRMHDAYNCKQYIGGSSGVNYDPVSTSTSNKSQKLNRNSDRFDWDEVVYSGSWVRWDCKEIKSGQVWSDVNCNGIPKDDDRWPDN